MKAQILKPGFLVILNTTLSGGVDYNRVDIISDHTEADGGRVAKWETERRISDAAEFERATQARGKARFAVASACHKSPNFGLMFPLNKEAEFEAAYAEAVRITDEFNQSAQHTQINVYALKGRIAENDDEAARAIASDVRGLLAEMEDGIKSANPAAIREAANKAKAMGGMLSAEVAGAVSEAIIQAREAARAIVKRVEKSGESAAAVVAELNTNKIESARFAFLDIGDTGEVEAEKPAARGLDLPSDQDAAVQVASFSPSQFKLEC